MYLLLIYFCLSSFFITMLLGKHLSMYGSPMFNIISLLSAFICSLFIFYEVCLCNIHCTLNYIKWFRFSSIDIYWSFIFDTISCLMLIIILFITLCANIYSIDYMFFEPHKIRFFSYLSLFTFTMILLVTANTLLQLFLGWECVGISSYLLINFWYTRIQANKSSILAIMANKIGDILLLFSCIYLLVIYKSVLFNVMFLCSDYNLEYILNIYSFLSNSYVQDCILLCSNLDVTYIIYKNIILNINAYYSYNTILLITNIMCFFLVVASICKSAQAGFHFWLAEAMEGPTPVSSLLHAATMVTAGLFLTVRCSFFFSSASNLPLFIIFIGALTSFFSSIIGVAQNDLKKIVAYSTCSQLGYMFISNGLFTYNYTMFHLFNHAFFKALLFLTSGYVIHILSNEQDLRKMGSMIKIIPFTYICLLIGSISLMGLPYFSGFFSKDLIIENFYSVFLNFDMNYTLYSIIFFSQFILSISVILTIIYSIKIIIFLFLNTYSGYYLYIKSIHFSNMYILIPLVVLSLCSMFTGYMFSDIMVGQGTYFWNNTINLFFFYFNNYMYNMDILSYINTNQLFIVTPYIFNKYTYYSIFFITLYYTILCLLLFHSYYIYIYIYSIGIYTIYNYAFITFSKKVLFTHRLILNNITYLFFLESYRSTYKLIDKNILEIIGPYGLVYLVRNVITKVNTITTGLLTHYAGIITVVLCICMFNVILYM